MVKRTLGGLLWFVSMWCTYELAIYVAGGPRDPGPSIALAVAALVTIDPIGLFWPRRSDAVPPLSRARDGLERPLASSR